MANQMNVKQVFYSVKGQELCKSRGGRPGLPVPNSPYGLCRRRTAALNVGGVRPPRDGPHSRASCPRMSDDILGTNRDQCRSMVQCCFTSTETVKPVLNWANVCSRT